MRTRPARGANGCASARHRSRDGYDRLNDLTSATQPRGGSFTYNYDPVGNRLSGGGATHSYDLADRLTDNSAEVDANGNLLDYGANTYGYDAANRVISFSNTPYTASYAYDGDGNRASRDVQGTLVSTSFAYTYDLNRALPSLLQEDSTTTDNNGTTSLSRKFVWGVGPAYVVDSSGNVQVYHADGLGSIRALTDASGNLTQTYQTNEFGVSTQTENEDPPQQPLRYTGEQWDYESGLMYLRGRYYYPTLGRFLGRDPLFGSMGTPLSLNRYTYALNNPTDLVDPSGFSTNQVMRDPDTGCLMPDSLLNCILPAPGPGGPLVNGGHRDWCSVLPAVPIGRRDGRDGSLVARPGHGLSDAELSIARRVADIGHMARGIRPTCASRPYLERSDHFP